VNAQVRIGADTDPHPSAILDLSDVSGNKLGLLYPNVSLVATTVFGLDGLPVNVDEQADYLIAARGMVVYNTNENVGQGEGIYLWNGREWTPVGINIINEDLPTPTYPLADFSIKGLEFVPAGGCGTVTAYDFTSTVDDHDPDYSAVKWSVVSKSDDCSLFYASSSNCVVSGFGIGSTITVRATSVENSLKHHDYTVTFVDPKSNPNYTVTVGSLTFLTYNLGAIPVDYTPEYLSPTTYSAGSNANPTGDPVVGNLNGDYYQWGRIADGHQQWGSKSIAGPVTLEGDYNENGEIRKGADAYGKFITSASDWRSQNDYLWDSNAPATITNGYVPIKTVNDPCPAGFRVPTTAEWVTVLGGDYAEPWTAVPAASDKFVRGQSATGTSYGTLKGVTHQDAPTFFLPAAGRRTSSTDTYTATSSNGYYWSSAAGAANSRYLDFTSTNSSVVNISRATAMLVRCVAE
jgi:uncharacterized protein (TIGR02145 family)